MEVENSPYDALLKKDVRVLLHVINSYADSIAQISLWASFFVNTGDYHNNDEKAILPSIVMSENLFLFVHCCDHGLPVVTI